VTRIDGLELQVGTSAAMIICMRWRGR